SPARFQYVLTGHGIPDMERTVSPRHGEAPVVGVEGDAPDRVRAVREGQDFLPGRGVPDLDHPVVAAGGQALAVAAVRGAEDDHLVALEAFPRRERGRLADFHHAAGGLSSPRLALRLQAHEDHPGSVGTEHYAKRGAVMALEGPWGR